VIEVKRSDVVGPDCFVAALLAMTALSLRAERGNLIADLPAA
jgi:hypothetical protein